MCIQTAGVLARWTGVKTEQMLCEGLRRGKILELVKYHRSHKQEATGTEGISVSLNRGYMTSLLHHQRDNDRVYIEKMQATIASIDIRKKLAIRERIRGI